MALKEPTGVMNAGNSGTTMRLVSGLLASQPFLSIITGDQSLRNRPMDRIVNPLTKMGATVMGRSQNSLPPLAIRGGRLVGIEHASPIASAQVKSCLLIAGLHAEGETVVHEPAISRDHTERMMKAMGANIKIQGSSLRVRPSEMSAMNMRIPTDISAASFWLVLACCHSDARIRINRVNINPSRTGVLDVLKSMGARIHMENIRNDEVEPVADLVAESSQLKATEISGDTIPRVIDEIPVLALAACFANGVTFIRDARELRFKESDRIRATMENLYKFGAKIEERDDGMVIRGGSKLTGTECQSFGDHRIGMIMGVAGLLVEGETSVADAEAVNVSYPDFWNTLHQLESGGDLP